MKKKQIGSLTFAAAAPALREKSVEKQISNFMAHRGWRRIRNNVGMMAGAGGRPVVFGERGMCDLTFVRYFPDPYGAALVLWVETKAPGASQTCRCRPGDTKRCRTCNQAAWRAKERERGAVCWVVDNFEAFALLYEEKFMWLTLQGGAQGRLF